MESPTNATLLALDVGERRIGVAVADTVARLASPLTTLERSDNSVKDIANLVRSHQASAIAIGLPRGLEGQETAQTRLVRAFRDELAEVLEVPLFWQDEALTSVKAEEELSARRKPYSKADIDALAATYILEDFIHDNQDGVL